MNSLQPGDFSAVSFGAGFGSEFGVKAREHFGMRQPFRAQSMEASEAGGPTVAWASSAGAAVPVRAAARMRMQYDRLGEPIERGGLLSADDAPDITETQMPEPTQEQLQVQPRWYWGGFGD
jgi:hypothetical protein